MAIDHLGIDWPDICGHCNGTGHTAPGMDMLARSPHEQAEYERRVKETALCCPVCFGSGMEPNP